MKFKVGQRVWVINEKRFDTIEEIMSRYQPYAVYESYVLKSDIRYAIEEDNLHQTADDMFKELGFEKSPNSNELYIVVMDYVEFDLETKTYLTSIENITPQLHLAIHQKLIELGWIE